MVGLDSDRDGRAFAAVDLEGDGDLDLIVKNRNSPQLVLLRNDSPNPGHSVTFKLIGRQSNRDAVGARIEIATESGRRTKFVHMGSGFLSQGSLNVFFGLGAAQEIRETTITWPSGHQDHFGPLAADQFVTVTEGVSEFSARRYRPRTSAPPTIETAAEAAATNVGNRGSWLVEPVPVPRLAGKNIQGNEVTLDQWEGKHLLVNFWATWCAPCQQELAEWKRAYATLVAAGAEVVAVSVDDPGTEQVVRQFVAEKELPFPVLLPDPTSVYAYKIFHRSLLRRSRDLGIPTTYLLNPDGEVVKVYRGKTEPEILLADLRSIPGSSEESWRAALPMPGRQVQPPASRDFAALAFSFMNADLANAALPVYFSRAVASLKHFAELHPTNKLAQLYLGVSSLASGQPAAAARALEQAIHLDPALPDAYFNLGVARSELGELQQAIAALQKAIDLDPGFADAYFNLAVVYSNQQQPEQAMNVLQELRRLTPDDPEVHNQLGVAQAQLGDLDRARQSFDRAVALSPDHVEALRNLGVVHYQQGEFSAAVDILERAHQQAPRDADSGLSLAVAYLRTGRLPEARKVLEGLLQWNPQEERARQLLEEISRLENSEGR